MKKLICVVGCGRSGTTWLQGLLSSHSRVASTAETYLFSGYLAKLWQRWLYELNVKSTTSLKVGIGDLVTEDVFVGYMRSISDDILGRVLNDKPGANVVLEKTPNNMFFIDLIKKIYPDTQFIHIVRDPRSVAASMIAASQGWGESWAPSTAIGAAKIWNANMLESIKYRDSDGFIEVRYEDLKADIVGQLGGLFAYVGLDVSTVEIETIAASCSLQRCREGSISRVAPLCDKEDFYRKGQVNSWRSELTVSQIRQIEFVNRKYMTAYGYHFTTSSKIKPFRLVLSDLITELAAIISFRLDRLSKLI